MSGWRVHVIGPDDLHDTVGGTMLEAVNLAQTINRTISNTYNLDGVNEHTPFVWAIPIPPGHTATLEARR